jgi:hypothetical protein
VIRAKRAARHENANIVVRLRREKFASRVADRHSCERQVGHRAGQKAAIPSRIHAFSLLHIGIFYAAQRSERGGEYRNENVGD